MDGNEFKQIFKTYEKPIYNYILLMVQNEQIAEELTEVTFIKIKNNSNNFSENGKLSTWIYQIATKSFLEHAPPTVQKKELETTQLIEDKIDKVWFGDAEEILSIDEQVVKLEMIDRIREFMNELPADCRAVIILHDLQGFKVKEISEILNCSVEVIKSCLLHARERFRSVLTENLDLCRG
jgi:RNA polymerase sigma-70 factor (ECF subfamily)